jgi:uncharacterized protein YjiS (DUF1127 family)
MAVIGNRGLPASFRSSRRNKRHDGEEKMALVLSGERPAAAPASFNPLRFLAALFAKLRAERAQRLALQSLLELDPHRLDDLGINRGDLFDAMQAQSRPTDLLARRRRIRTGQ